MWRNDNWGWRARLGMFIVASEPIPEAEWWAMVPTGVSVHAARVTARAPWARWRADRSGVDLENDLARGAQQLATMQLEAVVVGHSSSSIAGGKGWDEAAVAALSSIITASRVTTNGLDSLAALRASGVHRPFLVLPPWYSDDVVLASVSYYRDHGLEPASHLRYDPGRRWRDLPPGEVHRQGGVFAQDPEALYRQVRAGCPARADGVFIAGTGFRCVAIIDALERDLGRPVLTANQVSLWHCLRLAGVRAEVSGYGHLFGLDPFPKL